MSIWNNALVAFSLVWILHGASLSISQPFSPLTVPSWSSSFPVDLLNLEDSGNERNSVSAQTWVGRVFCCSALAKTQLLLVQPWRDTDNDNDCPVRMIVIMLWIDPHGDYDQMMIGIIRMVALTGSWDDHNNNQDDHDEWNSDNISPIATPIRSWHWLPSFYIFLLKRLFFWRQNLKKSVYQQSFCNSKIYLSARDDGALLWHTGSNLAGQWPECSSSWDETWSTGAAEWK